MASAVDSSAARTRGRDNDGARQTDGSEEESAGKGSESDID
jgi:hypothetical protein